MSPLLLAAAVAVSLAAGVVRGFAGFGYSALTVAGLAVFVSPAQVVPAVLALEVLASLSMMRGAVRSMDRRWMGALLWGNALCIPLGLAALARLPAVELRLIVGGALLCGALVLRAASGHTLADSRWLRGGAGVASGLLNGVAASGGVAAAMLMAAARLPAAPLRGTMVCFLFFAGAYALAWAAAGGVGGAGATALVGPATLQWAAVLAPGMLVGIWIGQRSFSGADPSRYRAQVLNLLIVVSALGLARAAADWLQR